MYIHGGREGGVGRERGGKGEYCVHVDGVRGKGERDSGEIAAHMWREG